MTDHYITEKMEAFNIAINALDAHEPGSDEVNPKEARRLRMALLSQLERMRDRWYDRYANSQIITP